MLSIAERNRFRKVGDMIIYRGDDSQYRKAKKIILRNGPLKGLCIVHSGTIVLTQGTPEGKEIVTDILVPGRIFGSLDNNLVFPYQGTIHDTASIIYLSKAVIEHLYDQQPALVTLVLQQLLEEAQIQNDRLSIIETPGFQIHVLARFILESPLLNRTNSSAVLSVSRTAIASYLLIASETISRLLKTLEKQGYFTITRERFSELLLNNINTEGLRAFINANKKVRFTA